MWVPGPASAVVLPITLKTGGWLRCPEPSNADLANWLAGAVDCGACHRFLRWPLRTESWAFGIDGCQRRSRGKATKGTNEKSRRDRPQEWRFSGHDSLTDRSAPEAEQAAWKIAIQRECERYALDTAHVAASMLGEDPLSHKKPRRHWWEFTIFAGAVAVFVWLAVGVRRKPGPYFFVLGRLASALNWRNAPRARRPSADLL